MNLEGRIDIGLRVRDGAIAAVDIASSRPQLAQRIMAGRTPAEAAEMAGLLFSLCGRAQRVAATIACAAAEGLGADAFPGHGRPILAEWAREHAWRLLLNWPAASGRPGDPAALQALHRAGEEAGPLADALDALLADSLLGEHAEVWLDRDWIGFGDWLEKGQCGAASLFQDLGEGPDAGAGPTRLLPPLSGIADDAVAHMARQALADPDFCASPSWRDETAETGVLARVATQPLVSAWSETRGTGTGLRLLARVVELAALPQRLRTGDSGVFRAWTLADGTGVAGVETSRGLLFHIARLDHGRVTGYRIVSPTEWNFHPVGPLADAMRRLPVDDAIAMRAKRLVLAFDPCVDYGVEIAYA